MKKRFLFVLIAMCTVVLTFVSCATDKEIGDEENQIKNEINLNNGACISESGNDFSIINFEDSKYENVDDKILIMNFNKESGEYLYTSNNQYFIHYKDLDILIEDNNVQAPLFSPNGEYLFYFTKDESLHPIVYDITNSKRIELDIKSSISGTYASWLGNDKIIFYGVDRNSKTSGIFSYNINNNLEKLEYQINGGYVSYIESFDTESIFLVEKYSGEKILYSLDIDGNSIYISESVDEVYDIEKINDEIYLLGKMKDNVYSLYNLSTNKRLIFDFPSRIDFEKGLIKTDNNEILFIGNNDNSTNEKIFAYSDNSIYILNSNSSNYNFIKIN